MSDLIEFVLNVFTDPFQAIGTIVVLGLVVVSLRLLFNRSRYNPTSHVSPETILRHRLGFHNSDLEQNRSGNMSPNQTKRIRNEFLLLLIVYTAVIAWIGFLVVVVFWEPLSRWSNDLILTGSLIFIMLVVVFIITIAALQLRVYIRDLRTRRVIALPSHTNFEEHYADYMFFKFQTYQYNIIANHPRLPQPLPLPLGFMSKEVWDQVQTLSQKEAILYITPNTSKLLSFELVAAE